VDLVTQSIRLTNENNSIKRQIGGAVENKYYFPQWRLVWDELPKLKFGPGTEIEVDHIETLRHDNVEKKTLTKIKKRAIDFYGREYWRTRGIEQTDIHNQLLSKGIKISRNRVLTILYQLNNMTYLSELTEQFIRSSGFYVDHIWLHEMKNGKIDTASHLSMRYYFLAPMRNF